MSLLDGGVEEVTIYPETLTTDPDGNEIWKPSDIGTPCRASVQPISSAEALSLGQDTRTRYRIRPARDCPVSLGAHARVEWRGRSYQIEGDPLNRRTGRATTYSRAIMVEA